MSKCFDDPDSVFGSVLSIQSSALHWSSMLFSVGIFLSWELSMSDCWWPDSVCDSVSVLAINTVFEIVEGINEEVESSVQSGTLHWSSVLFSVGIFLSWEVTISDFWEDPDCVDDLVWICDVQNI